MKIELKFSVYSIFLLCLFLSHHVVKAACKKNINYFVYISLRDDNAVVIYNMNPETGNLDKVHAQSVSGGPAPLAMDPTKRYLYVAQRSDKTISAYRVDHQTGRLTYMNKISAVDNPVYIAPDKKGRYLLSAYYSADKAAIYAIDSSGKLLSPAIQIISTSKNPHSILTDASNKYLFISNTGADKILQFHFDAQTGKINSNNQSEIITTSGAGPRHFDFHGTKNIIYFVNEKNSSVTAYHLNDKTGTLSPFQTISTLPEGFTGQNTCADIHLTPDDKFLYASNRGHESIAAFSVDPETGELTSINQYSTEKTPREFDIDPTGNFLFAAGQKSDKLASYRINRTTGELEALKVIYVGNNPSWVLAVYFTDSTETKIESPSRSSSGFYHLNRNFPNPFNSSTCINYFVDKLVPVKIQVYNPLGKIVTTLINEKKMNGHHTLIWDGKDNRGVDVSSGIYFCKFESSSFMQINKMILLR